jgi:hypothetical protein
MIPRFFIVFVFFREILKNPWDKQGEKQDMTVEITKKV